MKELCHHEAGNRLRSAVFRTFWSSGIGVTLMFGKSMWRLSRLSVNSWGAITLIYVLN